MSDSEYLNSTDSDESSVGSVDSDDVYADVERERYLRQIRFDFNRDTDGSPQLRAITHVLLKNAEEGGILHNANMKYDKHSFEINISDIECEEVLFDRDKYRCFYFAWENPDDRGHLPPKERRFRSRNIEKAFNWLLDTYKKHSHK